MGDKTTSSDNQQFVDAEKAGGDHNERNEVFGPSRHEVDEVEGPLGNHCLERPP